MDNEIPIGAVVWSKKDGKRYSVNNRTADGLDLDITLSDGRKKAHGSWMATSFTILNPFLDETTKIFNPGDKVKLGKDGFSWIVESSNNDVTVCLSTNNGCFGFYHSIAFPTSALNLV
ncbi:MAG: hypothetical protein ABIN24_09945 [Dyadobacter sp.]